MTTARALLLFLLSSTAALAATPAPAPAQWIEGQHYFKLAQPQRPDLPPGKLALTEVFSYGCPACNGFLPYMRSLQKRLPPDVVLDYVPAAWLPAEDWPVFQRSYLAAKALGVADRTHEAVFDAIWKSGELATFDARTQRPRSPLPSIEDVAAWYQGKTGTKAADFLAMARSFSIEMAMRHADEQILKFQAESTPTLIVNGKYRLNPASAGGADQAITLALWLLEQERGH